MKKWLFALAVIIPLTSFTPKPLTWLALGDSITYLNEHPNETGNRITQGYMTMVTAQLPNIRYINQGHNGWTVVRIAREIGNLGLQQADIYSVFLGTNDWWSGQPLGTLKDYQNNTGNGTVYGAYRTIINKLRSLNSKATFILISPMQRGDFVYISNVANNAWGSYKAKNGQQLEQFAAMVKAIGQYEHFKVIDLYHAKGMGLRNMVKFKRLKDPATGQYRNYTYPGYTEVPFNPAADEYPYPAEAMDITYDGLHPSDKGYKILASRLVKVMKKL